MELLSGVLVNNGMKNLKKYNVSQIYRNRDKHLNPIHRIRHITELVNTVPKETIYLCNYISKYIAIFTLHDYSIGNIDGIQNVPICKICLNKLPIKVKEEFIYNWAITKLKAR